MYGEKVEQAQELQLDLEDVKEMYKSQVLSLHRIPSHPAGRGKQVTVVLVEKMSGNVGKKPKIRESQGTV